ncbi:MULTISPECIES: CPBP family intramembrane glutamic endopeptidase [Sutcliffiella]|uniref:CPBP family intramembrane glutamic endopeptidase n=1 Tax=Sutcliffiella TaxID=2837511 RepID=UPI0008364C1E|nr:MULTISPECIES: type II CAAX endopeptidase family protein [Sutcliffiella]WBL17275.1 type II CAAX endopeptidase family protein [Sutcliffiella sp. NC1]
MTQFGKLLATWILANVLIGISFTFSTYFWTLFPLSMIILIYISWKSNVDLKITKLKYNSNIIGIISGISLYFLFLFTYVIIKSFFPYFVPFVQDLYSVVGPKQWWHYVLLLIIIPGEEIFWRGYIQKKCMQMYTPKLAVLVASALYAVAHIWSGNVMLVAAAALSGLVWGYLYVWTKNLTVVILSHFFFNLFLLLILPLTF